MRRQVATALAALCLSVGAASCAPHVESTARRGGPPDYAELANWLCWPGRADACGSDLTTTVVAPDGSTTTEKPAADPAPPIDCFYVYPTVSRDTGPLASMQAKPEEVGVVVQQAARLTSKCRLFAPLYRQFTLSALGDAMRHGRAADTTIGFNDLKSAWRYYLDHENQGRGVVLIGHSQGARLLTELIRSEIDGKPAQARLVSAILMGTVLAVRRDEDVGGAFHAIPLCRAVSQLGCAIAYASYEDTSPPTAHAFFGRPPAFGLMGTEAACVNPAALGGGTGLAKSYFGVRAPGSLQPTFPWLKGKSIDTPFVTMPGLISATCTRSGGLNYISIHLNPDSASRRSPTIPTGDLPKEWGLHELEPNLFMGNLVDIVGDEGQAWAAKH